MSETDSRDPGERYLSCVSCGCEWDDTEALGEFDSFTDCPECGGEDKVVRVRVPEDDPLAELRG